MPWVDLLDVFVCRSDRASHNPAKAASSTTSPRERRFIFIMFRFLGLNFASTFSPIRGAREGNVTKADRFRDENGRVGDGEEPD